MKDFTCRPFTQEIDGVPVTGKKKMHREFVSGLHIRPTPLKYAARVRCVLLDEWHKVAFKQRKTNNLQPLHV